MSVPFHQHSSTSALKVVNRMCTEHINKKGTGHFLETTCYITKDNIISLLELNNWVFFQGKFSQQLQGVAFGFPISPVIYVKYLEELALGPECPIPTPWLSAKGEKICGHCYQHR